MLISATAIEGVESGQLERTNTTVLQKISEIKKLPSITITEQKTVRASL